VDADKRTDLRSIFKPKVCIINHDPYIDVHSACSNLAIKYNVSYVSVSKLIRHHIENRTAEGI
jgi:dihydroneopterin aldolase